MSKELFMGMNNSHAGSFQGASHDEDGSDDGTSPHNPLYIGSNNNYRSVPPSHRYRVRHYRFLGVRRNGIERYRFLGLRRNGMEIHIP